MGHPVLRPVVVNEVHGLAVVPSHTPMVLPGTDVQVFHETGYDVTVSFSRPPAVRVWEQPSSPVLSSELP